MQYMLMIFEDEAVYADPQAWDDILKAHTALAQQFAAEGVKFYGDGLGPSASATTVKRAGGQITLHDGPFAETREQLGGYYVVTVDDLDQAIAWAKRIPLGRDGAVEVRPVMAAPPEAEAASTPR